MKRFFFLWFLLSSIQVYSQEEGRPDITTRFGKGVSVVHDTSFALKFGTRFQTLFTAQKELSEGSSIEKDLLIRRARIKFSGYAYSTKIKYKIELAISNRDNGKIISEGNTAANIILDAFIDYSIKENLSLRVGQFKLPGNRERVISSQNLQFVDRSLVNSVYNLDRDQGVMLSHQFRIGKVILRDIYAVAMGQGRNIIRTDEGGFSYTGRVEVLPFGIFTGGGDYFGADILREETPKLSFGAGVSFNNGAYRDKGERGTFFYTAEGSPEFTDLSTYFADLMFKYRGISVLSEFMYKNTYNPIVDLDEELFFRTGSGFVIQAGYLFKNNFELAGRFTTINPDKELLDFGLVNTETEYTLGASRYIVGHNLKIQSDLSYTTFTNDAIGDIDPELRFRLQMEMAL